MAVMGTATTIPIFDPVFNTPELADDELVLVEEALAPAPPELADDDFVLAGDVLGPVGTCAELASACAEVVELGECIAELVAVGESEDTIELAIGMGLWPLTRWTAEKGNGSSEEGF